MNATATNTFIAQTEDRCSWISMPLGGFGPIAEACPQRVKEEGFLACAIAVSYRVVFVFDQQVSEGFIDK